MKRLGTPKQGRLSTKLTMLYGLLFFTSILLVSVITVVSVRLHINHTVKDQITNIYDTYLADLKTATDVRQYDYQEFIQIYDNINMTVYLDRQVVYTSGSPVELPIYNTTKSLQISTTEKQETSVMSATGAIRLEDGTLLQAQILKNMDNEQDYLKNLTLTTLAVDAIILILSLAVGHLLSRRALSPIDQMTHQVKQISAHNLDTQLAVGSADDELSRLAKTFNDLFERIRIAYHKQSEFSLNASHELGTPLAIMKGYADLILRWGKDDPAVLDEGIQAIRREIVNMTKMLDDLLLLSKSDKDLVPLEPSDVDLNQLIEGIVKDDRLIYPKVTIRLYANDHIHVDGDRRMISEMIRALIDNAVKYSKKPSLIEIGLRQADHFAEITVKDEGIGIPKEDLPHLFERFYRVDKSRNKDVGGTGLGLSIVKWIVDKHQGTIDIQSELGEGTAITIRLPNQKAA